MAKSEQAKTGMDAVIEKVSKGADKKRKPLLARKGAAKAPRIAIMIAVGKPKPGMGKGPMAEMGGKAEEIAAIQAKIAKLKAKLEALGGASDEMDDDEDESEDDED